VYDLICSRDRQVSRFIPLRPFGRGEAVLEEGKMSILVWIVPAFLFLVGLCVMLRSETKCIGRDESTRDPMFIRKQR